MTTTATIETLTAEVRTLVVGSRQVTLSVAKQLDNVPLADLTVFGRVKLGQDLHYVIGSDTHGQLALAWYNPSPHAGGLLILSDDIPGFIRCCAKFREPYGDNYPLTFDGLQFNADKNAVLTTCSDSYPAHAGCVDTWTPEGMTLRDLSVVLGAMATQEAERFARERAACAAPLIVLAGLK